MSNAIIDYNLGDNPITNPDGSHPAQVTNCIEVAGPGTTPLGNYPKALRFPGNAYIVSGFILAETLRKFAARLSIQPALSNGNHQVVISGNGINLNLENTNASDEFTLIASIAYATVHVEIMAKKKLKAGQWYVLDMVFDTDTWSLSVDEQLVGLTALSATRLLTAADNKLVIGADRQGFQHPFTGSIAFLKIYNDDIPDELENKLDEQRVKPEWFLSKKYNLVKDRITLGATIGGINYDNELKTHTQQYEKGQIAYNETLGNAVEMHGSIYKYYQTISRQLPGTPVTDELVARKTGAKKSAFAKGAIYWSAQTGAFLIINQMYVYYENLGESGSVLGLPIDIERSVSGGKVQKFENGVLMFNTATDNVFEVPNAFYNAYNDSGGISEVGFPISGYNNILNASRQAIGKQCAFEKGIFYYSNATGINYVPEGRISVAYSQKGGVKGSFGFPTAGPRTLTINGKAYTCCTFQGGAIIDNGSTVLFREPLRLSFDTIATSETEGWGRGENDLYMYLTVQEDGVQTLKKRFPESGSYGGRNIVTNLGYNTPASFTINHPDKKINIELDVWEEDPANADDHPGTMKKTLSLQNLWGLLEAPEDLFRSGPYGGIKYVIWSIKPQVAPDTSASFWNIRPIHNPKTPEISRAQFAEAFRDVDSEPEWYDVSDWLKKLYMEITKGVASSGNCSGFCTEAIYARKDLSPFSIPLNKYEKWETVRDVINVKQCYQVGDSSIRWFVNEFIHGNTSNPVEVYRQTQACFRRGDTPILCVAENYFSGGSKHCLLPVSWDSRTKPWKIGVFDPNEAPSVSNYVEINPDNNTYSYQGSHGGTHYTGRITYVPWSRICHTPRTPLLETLALLAGLLAGGVLGMGAVILLIAGDAIETDSLTDAAGNNLNALKENNGNFSGKFLPYFGLEGSKTLNGEIITSLPGQFSLNEIHHHLKGNKDGKFQYCLKKAMSEFGIETSISLGELNNIKTENLTKQDQITKFDSPRSKLVNFITHKNLGGSDNLRVALNNIPVKAGLQLNFQAGPGLNYIDILHGEIVPEVKITIESKINNQLLRHIYTGPSEGGSRIFLSNAMNGETIKTASISKIGGSSTKPVFLKKQ